jgi:PilZ domain
MLPAIRVHLAQSRQDFESALELLQVSREQWLAAKPAVETKGLWLTKHHALPSTNIIVATLKNRVIGAICIFGDNPFLLPFENGNSQTSFRSNLAGRVAEISLPGLHPSFSESRDLVFALYHFALCFGAIACHYDSFVAEAPANWTNAFAGVLGYQSVMELKNGNRLLYLNVRESPDLRRYFGSSFQATFHFPEKKFFLVALQTMSPDVFHYLFNERTHLFSELTDLELRVLRNVYDFGEYAKALPERSLKMPFKRVPKDPRFPMNCEGYLTDRRGDRVHLQVLDVSRGGLKVRAEQVLQPGACYALTLYVGVREKSEIIADAVWSDEIAEISGLRIHSGDENWSKLIRYLEKDYLRSVA